jgi:predicted phage tail protein
MKTVILLGELGKKFGRKFRLNVKTPAEAVRALRANFPEFEAHMVSSESRNVRYKVLVGKETRSVDHLHDPVGRETIKFVPVIAGAGGFVQAVVGAVLIAVGVFIPSPLSPYLINAGVAMVVSGVVQMLTPVPKTPKMEDRPDNKPSYVFNGAVNTTSQGYPVPVGYGRMTVGSAVISAGISTEEIPI